MSYWLSVRGKRKADRRPSSIIWHSLQVVCFQIWYFHFMFLFDWRNYCVTDKLTNALMHKPTGFFFFHFVIRFSLDDSTVFCWQHNDRRHCIHLFGYYGNSIQLTAHVKRMWNCWLCSIRKVLMLIEYILRCFIPFKMDRSS